MLARALARQLLPVALIALPVVVSAQSPAGPLVLEAKIPLGAVNGRIDHLAVDLERRRLFVAELGNDSLGVVDLEHSRIGRNR